MLLFLVIGLFAQVNQPSPPKHHHASKRLRDFYALVRQVNADFTYPNGFREIPSPEDENNSFDYALELPGRDFEIWFKLSPEKADWFNYVRTQSSGGAGMANPDSVYISSAQAMATNLAGEAQFYEHNIPSEVLSRYHADAGRSYLLQLLDLPDTKHYKYALLIILQKNHTGSLMAICFGNDKGPDFFKNINRASRCFRFKP